jgi:hypothetical protein
MQKSFNLTYNVGRAKYAINYHDGETKHKDGSPFFGTYTFKNKRKFEAAQKELIRVGYVEKSFGEVIEEFKNKKRK